MNGIRGMTKIKLKYIHQIRDRHGHLRRYFRRGDTRATLPGLPGSAEFMAAYADALARTNEPPAPIGSSRTKPRTIAAVIAAYYGSDEFRRLSENSRKTYRFDLEKLRIEHGDKRAEKIERRHVREQLEKLSATPSRAKARLRALRMIIHYAMDMEWRKDDPTIGIKPPRLEGDGYKAWSEDDIHTFEARHPIGTRARLAFGLALYTGQRRSDIIRMARADMRDGTISVRQQKTGARLVLPIHPALASIIVGTPVVGLTSLLTTDKGGPLSASRFSSWFSEMVAAAGLDGLSVHGLRKAASRRLAEAGCTPHEIASITGHETLAEVERYTKSVNQARMARGAMAKLGTKQE